MPPLRWFILLMTGLFAVGVVGMGCARTGHLTSVNAGRTQVYEPGLPNFDLEVVATVRAGEAGIDLYLGLPHTSLVFLPVDGGFEAQVETIVRVLDERGKTLHAEYDDLDTVRVARYEATQDFTPFIKEKRLAVPPGSYLVEVTVIDGESEQEARRQQRVDVVAAGSAEPALGRIRLEGRYGGRAYRPVVSLHAHAGYDSLRAVAEGYNMAHLDSMQVIWRLIHFPSDTTVAAPPFRFMNLDFHSGIRYDRPDTLQQSQIVLHDLDESVAFEFVLPPLTEGVYRVEVTTEATPRSVSRQRRIFVVRRAAYPFITTLDEMVEALVYMAYGDEHEHITAAETPAEKKRRFDAFWGRHIRNEAQAASVLELYYSRVEEANLLYSTYKEGWKTDRGMIYIMFGAPILIDTGVDREVWHYSYNERDAVQAFVFHRRRIYAFERMFDVYALERDLSYQHAWYDILDRWRKGEVL